EALADVAEDRVDRVLEALRERDVPEGLNRSVRACRIRDPLAVFGAVAGVVEAGLRRELVRVERRRRGDDLEGRSRREEPVRRAVQKRRGGLPWGSGRGDLE